MGVAGAEDQGFVGGKRIQLIGERFANHLVKGFGDHLAVESLHLKTQLIRRCELLDLRRGRVVNIHFLPSSPSNAFAGKFGVDPDRRLVVHQETIHHRLAVAVYEHRLAEYPHRVQGRRGRESDLDGVKHLEHLPIFRDVVVEIPEAKLTIT